jgi:hypothetical protein
LSGAKEGRAISELVRIVDFATWADEATAPDAEDRIAVRAWQSYMDRWPNGELLRFPFGGADFWYDTFDDPSGRESRTVAGWTRIPETVQPRDVQRQRGYPLSPVLAARGFERGHLIARASGGGLDVNLFPQAWQINRGRGSEGREFRRLERLAAASPGALQVTRLLWTDDSNIPTYVHVIVAVPGREVVQGVFTNEPIPRPPRNTAESQTDRPRAATSFHRTVQTQFVADLVGAVASAERTIRLFNGRTGRVDLLVVTVGSERMAVIVEVKNTDWDKLRLERIRPNLRSHLRLLQNYLDTAASQIGEPDAWDSAAGVLIYPRRPADANLVELITRTVESVALMLVWHDEATWGRPAQITDGRSG